MVDLAPGSGFVCLFVVVLLLLLLFYCFKLNSGIDQSEAIKFNGEKLKTNQSSGKIGGKKMCRGRLEPCACCSILQRYFAISDND